MYSPKEVELFLLDYKDGVEFNSYTNPYLTHASLVAVNSNVSYGLSFLEYILDEKNRRSGNRRGMHKASGRIYPGIEA